MGKNTKLSDNELLELYEMTERDNDNKKLIFHSEKINYIAKELNVNPVLLSNKINKLLTIIWTMI